MINLITHNVQTLFPDMEMTPSPGKLLKNIQVEQYIAITEDIYQLNLVSTDRAIEDISYIIKLDDPDMKGIAWASLGGIHTYNGNYRQAYAAFNIALDQPVKGNVKAYIFLQISHLIRKIGYTNEAIPILKEALRISNNEILTWSIKTGIGLCYKYTDSSRALSLLKDAEKHYSIKNVYPRLVGVLRHISHIYSDNGNYKKAEECIDKAEDITVKQKLLKHKYEIMNDRGWVRYLQGDYEQARFHYLNLIQKDLYPYQLSLALQNLGVIESEIKNYKKAITYHIQSLRLNIQYGMRDMAIEDYYRLGLCHEKLGDVGSAHHFYSHGYKEVVKEFDLKLPLIGYRKKIIESFVKFLEKNQKIPNTDLKDQIFEFAIGKTLKEIRTIFYTHLMNLHLSRTKNAPELCQKLEIDTKTYFNYQKRLGIKRGILTKTSLTKNTYFMQYLESLSNFSWKDANKSFDHDLLNYLLEKYQNNKKKLSIDLGISYPYLFTLLK